MRMSDQGHGKTSSARCPGTLHHVMGRGIEGRSISRSKKDREDFLRRVGELCGSGAWVVYAWMLMANHFHIMVRTGNRELGMSMRKLLTGYAINFNIEVLRSGGRTQQVPKARRVFCRLAVQKMKYPAAQVARFLGVTTAAVVRAASTVEPETQAPAN